MANPSLPGNGLKEDADNLYKETEGIIVNDKVVVSSQQALVADSAVTATLTGVDTGTDMTAAQAATIVTDLTDHVAKINAILDVLESHGLMADA